MRWLVLALLAASAAALGPAFEPRALQALLRSGDADDGSQFVADEARAAAAYAAGDLDGAVRHFRRALTARPQLDQTYLNIARLLRESGQPAEAAEVLQAGLAAVPESAALRAALPQYPRGSE